MEGGIVEVTRSEQEVQSKPKVDETKLSLDVVPIGIFFAFLFTNLIVNH